MKTRIDNHVHLGVEPLFYLKGGSPYCLDLDNLRMQSSGLGLGEWVVFPFPSYFALEMGALRAGRIEISHEGDSIPYRIENRRLLEDLARLPEDTRKQFRPFLMADPRRHAAAQVRDWELLANTHRFHGIKIQATIIQSPITGLLAKGRGMLDFAQERNLPFLIHSSIHPEDNWSQCADILRIVESRPEIRFVLAHSCRFHRPSLDRINQLPNAWFDCSAHIIHCQCAVAGYPTVAEPEHRFPSDYTSPATVLRDLAEAYPHKLIWGSDAPFYSYQDKDLSLVSSYREEVDVLNAMPQDIQERISHENTIAWLEGQPS